MAKLTPEIFPLKDESQAVIRSFEPTEWDLANHFAKQIAAESTHTLKYEGMPEIPEEKWNALSIETQSHPVNLNIGAFTQNQPIGTLRFFQRNPNHPWIKHIGAFGMAISQAYWGQGIGTRLLRAMEAHARKCGITRIEAEVRVANDRGVSLYTKNGFKIEGRREKAALIDGTFVDEFFIAKLLT